MINSIKKVRCINAGNLKDLKDRSFYYAMQDNESEAHFIVYSYKNEYLGTFFKNRFKIIRDEKSKMY